MVKILENPSMMLEEGPGYPCACGEISFLVGQGWPGCALAFPLAQCWQSLHQAAVSENIFFPLYFNILLKRMAVSDKYITIQYYKLIDIV
jgi:hypothetical protein